MAADDTSETLTIRLPRGLKELVDEAARSRSTTVTSLVRTALQESLHPAGKLYQPPGFTGEFDAFVKKVTGGSKRVILLVADEDTGRRYSVSGVLVKDLCNESLVAIARPRDVGTSRIIVIPRRDVIAWYEGDLGRELSEALARQGWPERSAA